MVEVLLIVLVWRANERRNLPTIRNKKSEECDRDSHITQAFVVIRPVTFGLSLLLSTVNRNLKQGLINLGTHCLYQN
jgi:hypothetical protein